VAASAAGHHSGVVGDDYMRITVFLAAVLFLAGIDSTFKLHTIRYALTPSAPCCSSWPPC